MGFENPSGTPPSKFFGVPPSPGSWGQEQAESVLAFILALVKVRERMSTAYFKKLVDSSNFQSIVTYLGIIIIEGGGVISFQ